MRGASALAISLEPSRRRVRLVGLLSRLWRFPDPACSRRPLPVTLTRFLVPECVLFFGMASSLTFAVVVLGWCWYWLPSHQLVLSPAQPLHLRTYRTAAPARGLGVTRPWCGRVL